MLKPLKALIGAVIAVAVVAGGLLVLYARRDSAEDRASLGTAVSQPAGDAAQSSADGAWQVKPGEDVFVGYRVHEKLQGLDKEVTGRTKGVTGSMSVAGSAVTAASFTADLTGLTSDDRRRDSSMRTRGIETERFPQATLELASPLSLPSPPALGQEITVRAPVKLTVHGVTKAMELPLRARWDGSEIRVATEGDGVRLQFQDFGFGAITVPIATTDDFGFLEVQLRLVPTP